MTRQVLAVKFKTQIIRGKILKIHYVHATMIPIDVMIFSQQKHVTTLSTRQSEYDKYVAQAVT